MDLLAQPTVSVLLTDPCRKSLRPICGDNFGIIDSVSRSVLDGFFEGSLAVHFATRKNNGQRNAAPLCYAWNAAFPPLADPSATRFIAFTAPLEGENAAALFSADFWAMG